MRGGPLFVLLCDIKDLVLRLWCVLPAPLRRLCALVHRAYRLRNGKMKNEKNNYLL